MKLAFIDGRPEGCECGTVISLDAMVDFVRIAGGTDVKLTEPFPLLRFSHVKRGECDIFMLVNESMTAKFDGELKLPVSGKGTLLRMLRDSCFAVTAEDGLLRMKLCRDESAMLVFGDDSWKSFAIETEAVHAEAIESEWTLTLKAAHGWPCDAPPRKLTSLYNITGPEGDPQFSGTMRYETTFTAAPDAVMLDLGLVGECAHVWLNGADLGERIDAPYRWDISGAVREGENKLTVEVTNSLVHQQPDMFSHFVQIPPSGLLGPVKLLHR